MTLPAVLLLAAAIDPDGMLRIDGARRFVLGLYDLPKTERAWEEAREAGFWLIRRKATAEAVREAGRHGFRAWTATGTLDGKNEASIRRTVEALRGEPALLWWETQDEPTFVWKKPLEIRTPPERIIATRRLVESLDPGRLFYLNHSPTHLVSTLQAYNAGTDIVATDVYPVIPRGIRGQYALWPDGQQGDLLNETISQVGQYTDKMRAVAGPGKPVFMVLQGFAWETIQKPPDAKMVLYPTKEQSRFMAWQAVAHGANGILYWGLHLGPADNPAWEAVRATAAELKQWEAALAARPVGDSLRLEYFETGHSLDRGIAYTLRPLPDGGTLLVAVNEDKNPVEVSFGGLEKLGRCSVPAEGRAAERRERFGPFTARVYRCSR